MPPRSLEHTTAPPPSGTKLGRVGSECQRSTPGSSYAHRLGAHSRDPAVGHRSCVTRCHSDGDVPTLAWVARRIRRIQEWWSAWNARVADRDIAPTAQALQRLGLADLPIHDLREAGRKTAGSVKLRYQLLTFAVSMGAFDLLIAVIKTIDTQRVQPDLRPPALMLAGVTLPLLMWAARRGKAIVGYRFLLSIMAAIEACEAVASADTSARHQALRHLDDTCSIVWRSLLRVHRISNSVRRGSPRQRSTKRHAALVVNRSGSDGGSIP